jgi:hypothetical protein
MQGLISDHKEQLWQGHALGCPYLSDGSYIGGPYKRVPL